MLAGHYVRCPIVLEENDKYFPRSFIFLSFKPFVLVTLVKALKAA